MHVQTCWQCGAKNSIDEDEQRGGPPACGQCGAELPTAADWQAERQEQQPEPRADYSELEADGAAGLAEKARTFFCTYALIVANIVVFVVMVASGVHFFDPTTQSLFDWGADFGPRSVGPEPWRMLTSMFIHIGIIHLALNMYALSAVGPLTERLYGRAGFLALYLISGVGGSVVSIAWSPSVVSAGASGAVFGLFGGLLGLLVTRRGAFPTDFVQHHTTSIIGFLGYNIFFGMTNPAINNAAHMGGLVTGFLMAIALSPDVTARRKWGVRQTVGTLLILMLLGGGTVVAKRKVEESRDAKLLSLVYSTSKVELKPGHEVYYTNLVTKEEAQTLAKGLEAGGYFKEGNDASATLSKDEHGYVVSYIPKQEVYERPNAERVFEIQATDLSADIFGGRPVTLRMCDEYFVPQKSARAGSRVTIGENQHVYLRGGATADEANALAALLRERRFLDGGGAHIELEKTGDGYEAFFAVKDGTWDEPGAVAWYETLASQLSSKIFSGRPVRIHLCDGELSTRKTVSGKQ